MGWSSAARFVLVVLAFPFAAGVATGQVPGAFEQGAFTNLRKVEHPVNTEHWESMGSLSADGRWIYFTSNRPPSVGTEWCVDLWVAFRSSPDEPFGEPTNEGVLTNVNSSADECTPNISVDDLVLTFYSDRDAPNSGDYDLFVATRESPDEDFGPALNFGVAYPASGITTQYAEFGQSMSCDRLAVYFASNRPGGKGGFDLYVATRGSPGGLFDAVRNLSDSDGDGTLDVEDSVNGEAHEFSPIVSRDNLTLFFSDLMPPFRQGGRGEGDIWMVTRRSTDEGWEGKNVRNLGPGINSQYMDFDFFVSHDWPDEGSTIWFTSDRRRQRHGNENCLDSLFVDEIWDADVYTAEWVPMRPFRRGDTDDNGALSLTDAVRILRYLFARERAPACLQTADVDDTGSVNVTDAVYLLAHLFLGGAALPEPFGTCGPDPTGDFYMLSCKSYVSCR